MASSAYCEPIAIVGMACRLPGDISSPSELWDFLVQERSAQSDFPKNRMNMDSWYHPNGQKPGSMSTKGGYFLSKSDSFREFDPSFFSINPLEATSMDPQQRKLLEVVYESFESAGLSLPDISGSNTGCFVGNFTWDIGQMQARDVDFCAPYQMTGGGLTILSNRINYVFNLKGPSLTLDTACSSTMYALHMACKSLQAGDCSAAIVGGTNLIFGIEQQMGSIKLGVLSPTSTCHTFDEAADGYGRAEAVGSIYIKRLSDAVRDKNPIRAIIRATSINTNGRGPGISHPSTSDQEVVIRKAYSNGALRFDQTGYFESHGTGTPVGDPIEFAAIGNIFGPLHNAESPLLVGSVKSNLGHGEAASSIPSLIKVVLSLENAAIPATIGIKRFNSNLNFQGGTLKVVQALTAWPSEHAYRRASINSFGYGGANAHTILDATESFLGRIATNFSRLADPSKSTKSYGTNEPQLNGQILTPPDAKTYLLPFSAHNESTLHKNVEALSEVVTRCRLFDLAYTLSTRRTFFSSRAFALVTEASNSLDQKMLKKDNIASNSPCLAFVFTGQGAQWPQMGLRLIYEYPSVRKTISDMDDALQSLPESPSWKILDTLAEPKSTSKINDAERSQTVCTALQVALIQLLRSWRIVPKVTIGHSSGEIAAAFAAGCLTAHQAIIIAYFRGYSVSRNNTPGGMLAVGLGATKASQVVENISNIGIACYNSPNNVTLSGTEEAINEAHGVFTRAGIFSRKLVTSRNAYHSRFMKRAALDYEERLHERLSNEAMASVGAESPTMFSSVTAKGLTAPPTLHYWLENLDSPVLFSQAMDTLIHSTPDVNFFVEIGPHSALGGPIKEIIATLGKGQKRLQYLSALKRNGNDVDNILNLAGSLFNAGYPVDLERINSYETSDVENHTIASTDSHRTPSFLVDLPRYQWNYEDLYWNESRLSTELRFRRYPYHDLLGSLIPGCSKSSPSWRNIIQLDQLPWLRDHRIGKDIVFPAAGYISLAIVAANQSTSPSLQTKCYTLRNVKIQNALILNDGSNNEIVVDLRYSDLAQRKFEFTVSSVVSDKWTIHASGHIHVHDDSSQALFKTSPSIAPVASLDGVNLATQDRRWYNQMDQVGLSYGSCFRTLSNIRSAWKENEATANLGMQIPSDFMKQESWYPVHPTIIDGSIQLAIVAVHRGDPENMTKPYLPTIIKYLKVFPAATGAILDRGTVRGRGKTSGLRSIETEAKLMDHNGEVLLETQLTILSLESNMHAKPKSRIPQPYSRLVWKPDINHLSNDELTSLFSETENAPESQELLAQLEELAALSIIDNAQRLPSVVTKSSPKHIQRFFDWIIDMGQTLSSTELGKLQDTDRQESIKNLVEKMSQDIPEASLIAAVNQHLSETSDSSLSVDSGGVILGDELMTEVLNRGVTRAGIHEKLERLVELIAHQNPSLNVLELGHGTRGPSVPILSALHGKHSIPYYVKYYFTDSSTELLSSAQDRFKDYHNLEFCSLDIEQGPSTHGFEPQSFDMIFTSDLVHAKLNQVQILNNCKLLLKPGGRLIMLEVIKNRLTDDFMFGSLQNHWPSRESNGVDNSVVSKSDWNQRLHESGFNGSNMIVTDYPEPNTTAALIIAQNMPDSKEVVSNEILAQPNGDLSDEEPVLLLYHTNPSPLIGAIEKLYEERGIRTHRTRFSDFLRVSSRKSRTIMLAELENPFLSQMSETEMDILKQYTQTATTCVWVTNSDVLSGRDPEKTLIFGFAKSVMTEQPSFHLASIDIDPDSVGDTLERSARLVVDVEVKFHQNPQDMDTEFVEKSGIVYTSRYIGDDQANAEFAQAWRLMPEVGRIRSNLSLHFDKIGHLDSHYFDTSKKRTEKQLGLKEVLIESRAFGLDSTGVAIAKGQQSHPFLTFEVGGVVSEIGDDVTTVLPGDRIICLKPNTYETTLVVDEPLCHSLRCSDDFGDFVGQLLPYTLAVRILRSVYRRDSQDNVLVDTSSSSLSFAAAQVALLSGFNVYATYSNSEQQELLKSLPGIIMINSQALSDPCALRDSSVQLIITNKPMGKDSSLHRIADQGARVTLISSSSMDLTSTAASLLSKGLTVSCLDPLEITSSNRTDIAIALQETIRLFREGLVKPIPSQVFDISNFTEAASIASNTQKKVVLTCSPETTYVPIKTAPEPLIFDGNATYLLVGCLGGLGRSLTMWMISRGARNFIYLSRSGADKPEAASLVHDLEVMSQQLVEGLSVQIVRGDVCKREDVAAAISKARCPIKGAVQAAMVFQDYLFRTITLEQFKSGIQPKVLGSIHLHELLRDHDLDFFVMTSSVLGAIGAATQSNYSAANAFLDAMARHRHSMGLPATSVALGMILDVGHVEEHPEVEVALKRNGLYGIGVSEYLVAMEAACRRRDPPSGPAWRYDPCASAHIVTGIDPTRVTNAGGKGMWHHDHRLRYLVHAMDSESKTASATGTAEGASSSSQNITARIKAAHEEGGAEATKVLVQELFMNRVSKLVLIPISKMSPEKPLSNYGMDSMISSELRSWAWKDLRADIPFMSLLDPSLTFERLADHVVQNLDLSMKT